jgi:osmotically-inducible protein OsmY
MRQTALLSAMALSGYLAFGTAAAAAAGPALPQDRSLEPAIKSVIENRLQKRGILVGDNIRVTVGNGTVTLAGTVQTLAQKKQAARIAYAVNDAYHVLNDLAVAPSGLEPPRIAAGIRGALDASVFYDIFDWCDVSVTDRGVATLAGWVFVPWHAGEFVKIAESQPGVTKVVDDLRAILPSDFDDMLRVEVARLVYEHPTSWSFARSPGTVHILVDRGVVTLAGTVPAESDVRGLADLVRYNTAALSVVNELKARSE